MPEKRKATFRVDEDGTLHPKGRVQWMREGLQLFAGGQVVITYERPKRLLSQNRAYWGYVLRPISLALQERGTPVSTEALHEHFKAALLDPEPVGEVVNPVTGEVTVSRKPPSTTDLTTDEFFWYCEAIKETEWVQALEIPFYDDRLYDLIFEHDTP